MTFALILAEVGQVAAKDISMSGGMNMVDGTFVTALLMGVAAVITAIGMLLWGKNYMSKREDEIRTQIANELKAKIVNDPLHVKKMCDGVSVQECNRRMRDLDDRVTRLEQKFDSGFDRLMDKLSAMDRESEQRSVALHRRMDSLVSTVSKVDGEVGLIKQKMFKTR